MAGNQGDAELAAMQAMYEMLRVLPGDEQRRILGWLTEKLNIPPSQPEGRTGVQSHPAPPQHTAGLGRETPTPKAFLLEKRPRTDVERVACLAYYLTHYREMPEFKTNDITKLN